MREIIGSFWWLWLIMIIFATIAISDTGKERIQTFSFGTKINKPILNDISLIQLIHFFIMSTLFVSGIINLLSFVFPK